MGNNISYDEISRASIGNNRNVVISKCSAGGFTVAQQIELKEEEGSFGTFLKGAIRIKNKESLQNFHDAIEVALSKIDEEKEPDWNK